MNIIILKSMMTILEVALLFLQIRYNKNGETTKGFICMILIILIALIVINS